MKKSLQVLVVFQFNGIDDTESGRADEIIQTITADCEKAYQTMDASAVWVHDAIVVEMDEDELV
jgi:hypothetical protein